VQVDSSGGSWHSNEGPALAEPSHDIVTRVVNRRKSSLLVRPLPPHAKRALSPARLPSIVAGQPPPVTVGGGA